MHRPHSLWLVLPLQANVEHMTEKMKTQRGLIPSREGSVLFGHCLLDAVAFLLLHSSMNLRNKPLIP